MPHLDNSEQLAPPPELGQDFDLDRETGGQHRLSLLVSRSAFLDERCQEFFRARQTIFVARFLWRVEMTGISRFSDFEAKKGEHLSLASLAGAGGLELSA